MTIRLGIVGWPLQKTFSPLIHKSLSEITNLNLTYEKVPIENLSLKKLQKINNEFDGYNVTIPHKENIYKIFKNVDNVTTSSITAQVKAVNTVKINNGLIFLTNTDVDGINQTFTSINFDIFEKTILILGSGGSAQTAKQILSNNNKILIASRNIEFGDITYPQVDNIAKNIDVVINTTPLGMPPHEKESLPINLELFKNLQLFFNFGYKVSNTLIEGISPSVKIVDGMRMLIAQAISSFNIWTEQEIKFDDVYEDILERLENES